ncbi:hypothetical protein L226DRAFT_536615 [Lentinus tigrinus ALCF2SS1-7]|uniref:START domain-containing protein n=1 Tax=Lentinus tigrinus ALCF2SS1-6 TaxID=1328759 RepID=A0A5C2S1I9_9APHY|nr:hypothetical protein L227DRAFT_578138 [Lentinus tigrinus ALCF2SS1-6]RPD73113.1 hypothetical protein L226DRAFT_536615 [Lentinus tigrinus ALCF2SS1-7]
MDGARLRDSWYAALDNAQAHFRQLLTSHSSPEWKRVPTSNDVGSPVSKGKGRAMTVPELSDVILHRRANKSGENIYRAVMEVPIGDEPVSLGAWKSVLVTPELRKEWDPAVESAQLLEMFDQATRISKVNFTLGWPANPRDAVTISRTFNDATTLIDISTSLPRSPDEPTYLRPSPPYVRSDVALFAWCIQCIYPQGTEQGSRANASRLRITCFWQHNFRLVWSFTSATSLAQQLSAMTVGLYKTVQQRGVRVPLLTGYGNGVSIERIRFAVDREALTVDYSIVPEDDEHQQSTEHSVEELHTLREIRRLTRSVEFSLPSAHGWDVQLSTKGSSEVAQLPWTAHATRAAASSPSSDSTPEEQPKFTLSVKHASLPNDHSVLKVRVVIERSGPSSGMRLNGIPQPIEELEPRNPASFFISQSMFQDASSVAEQSLHTQSSVATSTTAATSTSRASTVGDRPQIVRMQTERSAAAEKSILSRVKRNYIYFSSLLQEPEAKWKQTVEARGVSVSQLDSIDPTLVVYRAEATFVGIGLWDLYAAITTPGARAYWDKQYDDAVLLDDVNELTELWHLKTKPAWPVNGRDMVVLKTVYKSPTTVHVFAFSADDPNLFPQIPPVDPNIIRTQVDLQGWAIEALSPNTTLVTLLEQSDPKGWSNKASIPQQMITAVAGIGEFAIKCGGPPIVTRLESAKANQLRYDHERGSFRVEYEGCAKRRTASESTATPMPMIECEIRCDLDTWATSLDIVVDPPPQTIAALRRHRFSAGGGGLWLTVTHDAVFSDQERLQAIVRRGPVSAPKDKGLVMVNGVKVDVDVEEMPEREAKNLMKQKRVKPTRVPLDQPPVLGVIRRRKAEWDADKENDSAEDSNGKSSNPPSPSTTTFSTTAPSFATSFSKFFTYAVEQATTTTQQAVAAISPAMAAGEDAILSSSKLPIHYALDALAFVQDLHAQPKGDGWIAVNEKDVPVHRKVFPEISSAIPVHKGEKVVEGVAAEEIASVLTSYDCRKQWDTRFDSVAMLEAYGADAHTAFVTMKGGFPFRDRGFYLASLIARGMAPAPTSRRDTVDVDQLTSESHARSAIFCVSASFSPDSVSQFAASKYNPYSLPVGRVFLDAWILETLDPYSAENYAIPSTRCTRVVAVDYAGSIPAAVNSIINGMLPKSILAVESYLKSLSPSPLMRLPAAGFVLAPSPEDKLRAQSQYSWTLRRRDPSRTFLTATFNPTSRVYASLMILNGSSCFPSPAPKDDRTPRPSRIITPNDASPATENTASSSPGEQGQGQGNRSLEPSASESRIRAARSRSPRPRSSTMFTPRGEVRLPVDLLVSELIVDSKLYPSGYDVRVRSRVQKSKKSRLVLPASSSTSTSSGSGSGSGSESEAAPSDGEDDGEVVLPVACAAYTLPPSPLHSAGLNADRPPRHLIRFSLPTAQYQMTTIVDPLTGETRSAPPKPQWLLDLEEGRAIIDVRVRPATGNGAAQKGMTVAVNGAAVAVMSEKESLTALGREELLETRAAKMDILARSVSAEEPVPAELQAPLAVAQHLLEAPTSAPEPSGAPEVEAKENGVAPADIKEVATENQATPVPSSTENHAPESAASGLMRILNEYTHHPFLRFSPSRRSSALFTATSSSPEGSESSAVPGAVDGAANRGPGSGGLLTRAQVRKGAARTGSYPLSTVVIVALIAFLVGSLLRSLLSPADFIYVVTDKQEISNADTGWRELKRLLEVKYVIGGWDFQIAVVRRH